MKGKNARKKSILRMALSKEGNPAVQYKGKYYDLPIKPQGGIYEGFTPIKKKKPKSKSFEEIWADKNLVPIKKNTWCVHTKLPRFKICKCGHDVSDHASRHKDKCLPPIPCNICRCKDFTSISIKKKKPLPKFGHGRSKAILERQYQVQKNKLKKAGMWPLEEYYKSLHKDWKDTDSMKITRDASGKIGLISITSPPPSKRDIRIMKNRPVDLHLTRKDAKYLQLRLSGFTPPPSENKRGLRILNKLKREGVK